MRVGKLGSRDRVVLRLNRDGLFLIFEVLGRRYCVSAGRLHPFDISELD